MTRRKAKRMLLAEIVHIASRWCRAHNRVWADCSTSDLSECAYHLAPGHYFALGTSYRRQIPWMIYEL